MGKELDKKAQNKGWPNSKDIFLSLDVKAMTLFVSNETWMRCVDVQCVTTVQEISVILSDSLRDKSHRHAPGMSGPRENKSCCTFHFHTVKSLMLRLKQLFLPPPSSPGCGLFTFELLPSCAQLENQTRLERSQEGLDETEGPFNPNCSVILWFYKRRQDGNHSRSWTGIGVYNCTITYI